MAGDLERFLQQAAERLAERVNQGAQQPARRQPPRPVRQAERQPVQQEPEILEAEIVEDIAHRRELGPDPLSNIDTRPGLAQEISLADEKMAGHLHEHLDHDIMHLRDASNALEASPASRVESRRDYQDSVTPLVQMLRNPDTIRTAFIASILFERRT